MGIDGNLHGRYKNADLNGLDLIFLKTCCCIYHHREHFQPCCQLCTSCCCPETGCDCSPDINAKESLHNFNSRKKVFRESKNGVDYGLLNLTNENSSYTSVAL